MKKFIALLLSAAITTAYAQNINGAGATFPAPVYSKWAIDYNKQTGIRVNYQPIGSGGGIKEIDGKTVDFGATDDPLPANVLKEKGLHQFPTVIGGVVPVINIDGIESGKLVLDGKTLADIYRGAISNWNDPQIKRLNPTLTLPNLAITLIVRSDSSGTTAVFTDYLSQVSDKFKTDIGSSKQVAWKSTNVAAGKGNAGVATFAQRIKGSIGYVEFSYMRQGKLRYVSMLDKKNKPVSPSLESFTIAAESADWKTPGMAVNLNNKNGWPITSATFILVHKEGQPKTANVLKFFDWVYTSGDKSASDLEYVPLPDSVKTQIRADWVRNVK